MIATGGFAPKAAAVDWQALEAVDVDALMRGTAENDELLDALYPMLAAARVNLAADPQATAANLVKLFQVTQLVMELQHIYVSEDAAKIVEQQSEIQRLEAVSQAAVGGKRGIAGSSAGNPVALQEVRRLEMEIVQLEQRNQFAVRTLQAMEMDLGREKAINQDLLMQINTHKDRNAELEEERNRLLHDVQEYRNQLLVQRERFSSNSAADEHMEAVVKEKNADIARYLNEVQLLSEKNAALTVDLDALSTELQKSVLEYEKLQAENGDAIAALAREDQTTDQLRRENAELQAQLGDITRRLDEKDSMEESLLASLQSQIAEWRAKIVELQAELASKDKVINALKQDMEVMRHDMTTSSADRWRKELDAKNAYALELEQKLKETQKDFELLSVDWNRLDKQLKSTHDEEQLGEETMVNAQLRKHMRATTESKVESEKLRELRSQDQQRLAVVEATLGEKESELMELRHRVDLFERGLYGMKEAMSEVTDLKLQRSIRDRNIGELTEAVNEHARAVQDLLEENVAMREKLGLPAETIAIDLTKIHHKRSLEYEQSKAMNIAYRKEIDRLEEERLQLKSQLRLQAMEKGERAVHLGLAAEDLMAVEEFAERLRYKGASDAVVMTSKNGKSIADSEQLNKLIANLDNVHQELRASRDDRVGLELEVRTLLQENQSLQAALKEVAETFVAGKPVRDDVSSATADPQLEQVQRLLVKLDNKSATQSVVTDRPTVAGESMVKVNAMLRHEITTLREKLHAQSGAVKTMEANVAQLQKELAEAQVTMPAEAITTTAPRVPIEQLIAEHGDLVPLTEQLVCALDELAVKTAELADAHAQLADFEMRLEVAVERQHQLHSASHRQEEQWAAEMNQLREAKTELELKCAEGEQRTAELEQLVDTQRALQSGDLDAEVVQQRLTDLTRRNIVLKVNEKALTRRYKALCESESHLRTQLEEARAELSRAEATATQTITRIRGQLQAQQLALATTRTTIENSVAKDDYDVLEAKFDTLNQKYQHALELSVEGVPTSLECLELREAASRSQLRIQELESQVATLEMAKSTLEGALGVHHDVDATTVGDATSPLLTKEYVKSLLTKTSKLTVGMDAAAMRAQFLESKCMAMEESESLLRTHLRETESKLMCAQTELLAQRETEGQLRLALTGSISRSEADSYRAEADKLNAEVVALRSEVDLYRELAATATRQVEDLRAMRAEHQKENEVLRAAMQEMQMQGDEKLVIGKLHQHIFALQVGEGTAARALEKEIDRNRKLELMLATTEKTAIDREKLLWNVRLEYKAKNHQIQKRFLQWKELYVTPPSVTTETPNGASSGRVTLTYYERLSAATQTLQSKYLELLQRTNQLQEERKTAVNENIRLISENEAKDEVIGALRVEVTGSGGQAILTQRMASWQQKLAELRAREMAQQREIIEKQEHISQLEALNREFMERAQSLEKKLLVEQTDFEKQMLDWEKRELELESRLLEYESDQDRALKTATMTMAVITQSSAAARGSGAHRFPAVEDLPDPALSVPEQLQYVLERLALKHKQLIEQAAAIRTLEKELEKVQGTAHQLQSALRSKEVDLSSAENQRANVSIAGMGATAKGWGDLEKLQSRYEELSAMSQASVESLQKQLANKEAQLRKYQDLLQRAKEAQLERSNVDREENSKLSFHVEELRSARDCLTTRNALLEQQLRETLDQATVEAARATESSQARLFTSEDMEEAIAEKERARLHLQTLVRRLEADNHELQQEMDVLKQASLENAVELKSLRDDYKELEEKANTVVRELDVANRQLENVQNECRRLSKELKERNTEIKDKTDRELSLTHALRAVKDEMIGEVSRLTVHKHDGRECPTNDLRVQLLEVRLRLDGCAEEVRTLTLDKMHLEQRVKILDNLEQALENAKVELSHERRLLKDKDVHIQRLQTNIENLMSAEPFDAARLHWENEKRLQRRVNELKQNLQKVTEELANAFKEKETAQNDSSTTKLIAQVATLQAENDKLVQRQIGFAAEHGPAQALEETRTTATRIELERKLIAAQFNDGEQSMEIARLKKKIVELEETLGQSRVLSRSSSVTSLDQADDVRELKLVIDHLSKALLRLQNEKASASAPKRHGSISKLAELSNLNKELRQSNEALVAGSAEKEITVAKLLNDKLRLQRKLKKVDEHVKELQGETMSLREAHGQLEDRLRGQADRSTKFEQELARERKHIVDKNAEISELRGSLTKLNGELDNLKRQLTDAMSDQQPASSAMAAELVAAQAKILELEQTVNDLRARNDELQADLNAFDHSFFDELEDLKFNYNEARRKNEELEKRLRGDDGDVNE